MAKVNELIKGIKQILFSDSSGGYAPAVVITDPSGTPGNFLNGNLSVSPSWGITRDAGERIRVAQLTTLGDYKISNHNQEHLLETVGTGSGTWADSKFNMIVASGEWYLIASRRPHHYFSGKSQVIEMTFDNFAPQSNVTKRAGYFSSSTGTPYNTSLDGIWLESASGTVSFRTCRNGVDTLSVPITSWNGYNNLIEYKTLSTWNNFTVCLIDFLWLGGAVCRLWVKTSSGFVLAHQFDYAGTAQDVFILSPNQPLRYEIRSTTGSGSFRYICSQVSTEGSIEESGKTYAVNTGNVAISVNSVGIKYPLISIRKGMNYRNSVADVVNADILVSSTNDLLKWTLEINPNITSPLSYAPVSGTSLEVGIGNGVIGVTGTGIVIGAGYITQGVAFPSKVLERSYLSFLGGQLDGTQDRMVLCVTPLSTNINTYASLTFKEY